MILGGVRRFSGNAISADYQWCSLERIVGIGEGTVLGPGSPLMIPVHELAGVMMLERFGQVV